jgi:hypothetical protein
MAWKKDQCSQLDTAAIYFPERITCTRYRNIENVSTVKVIGKRGGISTAVQGSIFWSENDIYSPRPYENYIFSPSSDKLFLNCYHVLFALILPFFALFFPSTSHFLGGGGGIFHI